MSSSVAEFWSGHLAAIEQRGCTVAEYAREHDLSAPSLYTWRGRLRDGTSGSITEQRVRFAEVVTTTSAVSGGLFVRIGDVSLEFDTLPDAGWLASLLETVGSS